MMKLKDLNAENCKFVIKEPIGKKITGILSGTNTDNHNYKLTLEQLKKIAEEIKSIPFINNEHDSSKTPYGKIINVEIKPSDNGEYELHVVCILFEELPSNVTGFSISFTVMDLIQNEQ